MGHFRGMGPGRTKNGIWSKLAYMAPEQARLEAVDGRADVFAVGVMLWEAIANRKLVDTKTASHQVLNRRASGEEPKIAEVMPDVDPELARICDRAMAGEPEDRYPGAAEFLVDLEHWLEKNGEPPRKE